MAPRLKVFQWSDGLHVFTVAATSRAKALKAWGVSQDLFATGLAHEVHEGADVRAAIKRPEAVIRKGLSPDPGPARVTKPARPKSADVEKKLAKATADLKQWERAAQEERAGLDTQIARLQAARAGLARRQETIRERRLSAVAALRERLKEREP